MNVQFADYGIDKTLFSMSKEDRTNLCQRLERQFGGDFCIQKTPGNSRESTGNNNLSISWEGSDLCLEVLVQYVQCWIDGFVYNRK